MYWSVVWCSGGCSWKCYKTLTFCSLLTRCTIPCACHTKRHLNLQKWSEPLVLLTFWLQNVLRATTACTFSTSQLSKVVREWCALYIFTSKCASRHNGVHFFDISTSKNAPRPRCFVPFHFKICFAPQWRATFHFSTPQMSLAPAALASLLFDPPEPQNIEKTQCFATFLPFRTPASSFFWSFLFRLFSPLTLLPSGSSHLCFFICPYCRKFDF